MKMTIKKLSILILVTIISYSCSSKKSGKSSVDANNNPYGNNRTYSNPSPFPTPESQQTAPISVNDLNRIKGSFQCTQGSRLSRDITYHTNQGSNSSDTRIQGPFNPGALPGGGSTVKLFVGVSSFNDIMIVSKIANGNQVIGYNITISYCSMSSQNGAPYISDQRAISNFQAQNGIVLYEHAGCGFGSVDAAKLTYAQSAPYQYLQAFPIWTTFFRACVN